MTDLRVALLSSSTVELLERPLTAALEERGFTASLWTAGFNQYRQEILNADSPLYRHEPDVVVLYLDGEDVFRELLQNPFGTAAARRHDAGSNLAEELSELVRILSERLPRATIILNTPPIDPVGAVTGLEYNSEWGIQEAVGAYLSRLRAIAAESSSVIVVDVAGLAASIGFDTWRDPRMWYLARARLSRRAMAALARAYASAIVARMGRIRKCVAVDLDNTLWGGIIGEDGFEGIKLGEDGVGRAFAEFQEELLNLYRKGILLAICSKNNPADALQVIREHPGMRLREEHFAAVRINWEDKASNLRNMAEELNIGLDSFVFLDDNPVERTWVRESTPEVLVPEWPADPVDYKRTLLELSRHHLQKLKITAEDRKRGELYKAQAARRKLESAGSSIEEFYRALEMKIRIGRADQFTIPRVAQLTQKTNQFNLTTRRYTEAEIRVAAEDPSTAVFWLELTDKFGPSGIVGVLILRMSGLGKWVIDTFLLSCRVMGRTVENAFLAAALREVDATHVVGEYRPTAKNSPVKDLYARLGFDAADANGDAQVWSLDAPATRLTVPDWFEVSVSESAAGSQRAQAIP